MVRYPYKVGDTVASGVPEVIIPQLSPVGGGHYTRDLVFAPDGRRFYVSVGFAVERAGESFEEDSGEIRDWESAHGFGTTWDQEENRADVRVFELGGDTKGRTFASGIRNCVGLTMQPSTNKLWCAGERARQPGR